MRKYLTPFLPHLGCGFFFSMFINVLQLSYLLYMRLLFDKVMVSRSGETLFYLTAGVIFTYVFLGMLEVVRSKLLVRVGVKFDQVVAETVFTRMIGSSVAAGSPKHTQGLKDLNSIRNFFAGSGIFAFFDTPWVPVYIAVVFLFHPWLGFIAAMGALALLLLVVAQEISTTAMRGAYAESSLATEQFMNAAMRNVQSVYAMGMLPALSRHWKQHNINDVYYEDRLAARTGFFQSMAKLIQMVTVVLVMSVGAYLVIIHEATIGTMIASSMIMSRALAPILMLGNAWKSLVESRIAYRRLSELMADAPGQLNLPSFEGGPGMYGVENVSHGIDGEPVLEDVNFTAAPGEIVFITGPSGAGKSTLARIMLGVWEPGEGRVMLGERDIRDIEPVELGKKVGYMPQEVELFSGTVAENIARLGSTDDHARVVAAAKAADAHQMILELPKGYDTYIGQGGISLSGGQRQRIALARALYGDPWIMVLDEPDSHLDHPGRQALKNVLAKLKEKGLCLIVISHNQELSRIADKTVTLHNGRVAAIETAETKSIENKEPYKEE